MKIRFYKMLVLVLFVLVFLLSYEFIKGNFKIKIFSKKSDKQIVFYCEDDSYKLDGNICLKYVTSSPILLGDVNSSDNIDLLDASIIKEYLDKKRELNSVQLKASDINSDGIVDINDINILQTNLNNPDNEIGKKFICDDKYELENNLCVKSIEKEAIEVKVKKGDINRNNKLDKNDLELLKNYLNSKGYLSSLMLKIADYNNDNRLDKSDLDYLKKNRLKDYKNKNLKRINIDSLDIDYDISTNITATSKKKELETDDYLKYYFDVKTNKNIYYKWYSLIDNEIYEKSMCNVFRNNIEYEFVIKVKGSSNYYIMEIYEDENCNNLLKEYKTEEFKMKSV